MKTEKGHYYHSFNRGNNRQQIFHEESDYLYLIAIFKKNTRRFDVLIVAYCLMPNHYHLLLRQNGEQPISRFIQSTFQSYAQRYNNRYERSGRLFENPRAPKHIAKVSYLFSVCRYIHRNPLEAGLVKQLVDWPYSNYPEFIGERKGNFYPGDLLEEWFASPIEYKKFVESENEDDRQIDSYLFK